MRVTCLGPQGFHLGNEKVLELRRDEIVQHRRPLNATELNTLKFTTMKEILIPHLHPRHVEVIGLGEAQVSQPPGKQVL